MTSNGSKFEDISSGGKRPEWLGLVTGGTGDRRKALLPDDPLFERFLWAWNIQNTWEPAEHESYWRAHLSLWERVKPARAELQARAYRYALSRGLDKQQAADMLGDSQDTLDRGFRRVRRDRDHELPDYFEAVLSDYSLPRIYADFEPKPNPHGYPAFVVELPDPEWSAELERTRERIDQKAKWLAEVAEAAGVYAACCNRDSVTSANRDGLAPTDATARRLELSRDQVVELIESARGVGILSAAPGHGTIGGELTAYGQRLVELRILVASS